MSYHSQNLKIRTWAMALIVILPTGTFGCGPKKSSGQLANSVVGISDNLGGFFSGYDSRNKRLVETCVTDPQIMDSIRDNLFVKLGPSDIYVNGRFLSHTDADSSAATEMRSRFASGEFRVSDSADSDLMIQELGLGGGVTLEIAGTNMGDAQVDIAARLTKNLLSKSGSMFVDMQQSVTPDTPGLQLNTLGGKLKSNSDPDIGLVCGNEYVAGITRGIRFMMGYQLEFMDAQDEATLSGSFNLDFKLAKVDMSATAKAYVANSSAKLHIFAYQLGGDPLQLLNVLPDQMVSCDLSDAVLYDSEHPDPNRSNQCNTALVALRDYFLNTLMSDTVIKDPAKFAPMELVTMPYTDLFANTPVWQSIEGRRHDLMTAARNVLINLRALDNRIATVQGEFLQAPQFNEARRADYLKMLGDVQTHEKDVRQRLNSILTGIDSATDATIDDLNAKFNGISIEIDQLCRTDLSIPTH